MMTLGLFLFLFFHFIACEFETFCGDSRQVFPLILHLQQ